MIVHRLIDGSFVAGDTVTRSTCYAYPSSTYARKAARSAASRHAIATEMLAKETRYGFGHEADYDARNWKCLGE